MPRHNNTAQHLPKFGPPEAALQCTGCGAVHTQGRWRWDRSAHVVEHGTCPACRRLADGDPAAILHLEGNFSRGHGSALIANARTVEAWQAQATPQERIMSIERRRGEIVIKTTGLRIAYGLGRALLRAFGGELHVEHAEASGPLRLSWHQETVLSHATKRRPPRWCASHHVKKSPRSGPVIIQR